MSCGACVGHISQALDGVDQVSVDLDARRVNVGGRAGEQALIAALDAAGYPARRALSGASAQPRRSGCGSGCNCH